MDKLKKFTKYAAIGSLILAKVLIKARYHIAACIVMVLSSLLFFLLTYLYFKSDWKEVKAGQLSRKRITVSYIIFTILCTAWFIFTIVRFVKELNY